MRTHLWLLTALLAVAGCGGSSPPRNLYVGGSVPTISNMVTYRIQPGVGISNVVLGSDAGYFITANTGGSYRLVWTGDANNSQVYRSFTGSVFTPGHFSNKVNGCNGNACPLSSNDFISIIHDTNGGLNGGGQRIDFDTVAANDLVGFDFFVDTEPVIFNVFIDNGARPDLIHFPATDNNGQISPSAAIPFGLISQ